MRMRTKLSIVTMVGAGALLLIALAVIIAPRPQIAYAQSTSIDIQFSSFQMIQGDQFYAQYTFKKLGSDTRLECTNSQDDDPCYFKGEILRNGATVPQCQGSSFGSMRSFWWTSENSKVIGYGQNRVSPNCPAGAYTLRVSLYGMAEDRLQAPPVHTDSESFTVIMGAPTAIPTNTPRPTSTRRPQQQPPPQQLPTATPTATPTIGPNEPTATPTATPTVEDNSGNEGNQGGDDATATPTATPTVEGNGGNDATATPTATPTVEGNSGNDGNQGGDDPTATSTATPTPSQRGGQIDDGNPTATPTATATPTVEGNGGNQGNQGRQPGGNNQGGNNQGGNNQGGNNQGGNNQGGVGVKSFISYPTPLPQSSQPQSQTPLAITIPEIMNVRTGPGLTYDIVTTVPAGTQAEIVGTDPNDDWYQVEIDGVPGQVWIYQGLTTLVGSLTGVKQYTSLEIAQLQGQSPSDGSAPLAITVPELMNVRTGPGLTYDIVTTVPAGTQGYIYGIDPNDDWFHIELEGFDTRVWVYQDLTTVLGSLATVSHYTALQIAQLTGGAPPATGTAPLAITIPELMNVRTGPGLTYDIVTTVPAGTQGYIYGIDPDDDWFHIELEGFDTRVWVYQDLTTVLGSLASVKLYTLQEIAQLLGTPGADGTVPLAITVPITMNVRTGPGQTYDIVGIVPKGTQGRIFGIDPDDDWFQIELEGLDTLVWVHQDLTTVIGSLAGVKWVTLEELALLPAAITQPALLNARAGPGLTYDILTTIPQGTWTKITGIDPQGEWYRVELYDLDQPAWIFRDYTKVAGGSLSGLIQLAFGGSSSPIVGLQTGSITVELSLPQAGGVDLDVSWTDTSACAQLYNLYHRSSTASTTYISLDQAATASTVNAKSLSFSTLSGDSYISAWCGTMAGGREVAEVEIDPGVAGTYSSTTTSGGLAAVPPGTDDN